MQDFQGQTAVITGAASGLGRAIALALAEAGAQLVLADLSEEGLAALTAEIPNTPSRTAICDVSDPQAVENLADLAYEAFGQVNLLFNNAGVAVTGPCWTATLEEWHWAMNVNVMGVVHGIRAFTQRMIDSGQPARIINTASAAGHLSVPGSSIYCASKHSVVTISECLHHELGMLKSPVKVSVLCPAFVKTQIADADRLRPQDVGRNPHPMTQASDQFTRAAIEKSKVSAEEVAQITLQAIREDRFYIFTHPRIKDSIRARMEHILNEQAPHNSVA